MSSHPLASDMGETRSGYGKVDVPWTMEEVVYLRRQWKDGDSASDIAKALGRSRNSVGAKLDRMGLLKTRETPVKNRSRAHLATPKANVPRLRKLPQSPAPLPGNPKWMNSPAWHALPGVEPVPLADLANGLCRWPIGNDRPYLFCGADSGTHVYCPHHEALSIRSASC